MSLIGLKKISVTLVNTLKIEDHAYLWSHCLVLCLYMNIFNTREGMPSQNEVINGL